jgi:hypothetical protein
MACRCQKLIAQVFSCQFHRSFAFSRFDWAEALAPAAKRITNKQFLKFIFYLLSYLSRLTANLNQLLYFVNNQGTSWWCNTSINTHDFNFNIVDRLVSTTSSAKAALHWPFTRSPFTTIAACPGTLNELCNLKVQVIQKKSGNLAEICDTSRRDLLLSVTHFPPIAPCNFVNVLDTEHFLSDTLVLSGNSPDTQ